MTAYCLLNHALTAAQEKELAALWGCSSIAYPPLDVAEEWAQMPHTEITAEVLRPFTDWLFAAESGSPVVLQGEAGATFALVGWCLDRALVPLHALSRRETVETREGDEVKKTAVFRHEKFRRYVRV